ncbi:MAG TPA: glutamine amidotransferase [Chthoniobacteraceae bacterium]|jgi:hypothetical protein|nr:glutamine amidotransferase [Chthoniobacteraceae bacterium]
MHEYLYEHSVPQPYIIAGLIAAALVALISLWRYIGWAWGSLTVAAPRLAFLALLGWCLFLPAERQRESEQRRPRFVVIADTSASMSLSPKAGIPSRWSVVQQILQQGWTSILPAKAQVDVFTFDNTVDTLPGLHALAAAKPKGDGTRLRDCLQQIIARYNGQPLTGILLLTDGNDTREMGSDWAAGPWPAPIYTVRLEPPDSWEVIPEVRIVRVDTPRRVVAGWQSELTAVISANGTRGQPLNVQLYQNDKLLQESPLQIPAEGGSREVKFQLDHPAIGTFTYKIKVPPLPRQANTTDNEYSVAVDVTDTKNRILYVEGEPRFEFKFLKRALERSKEVTPIILMQGPDGNLVSVGHAGTVSLTMSHDQLAQFKIAILGNLNAAALGDERARSLVKFVDEGGSLILLGGDAAWSAQGFAATPLKQLLPVQRDWNTPVREGEFKATLTREGEAHPALQSLVKKWTHPMPVLSIYPGSRPTAGATTVFTADNNPLVVTQRFGQGKVAAILSNSLWRWQLEPGQQDEYLSFWDGLLQWLMPQASNLDAFTLDLSADAEQLFMGDTLQLTARAGGSRAATESVPVNVEIQTPDGRKVPYAMQASAGNGQAAPIYTANYRADASGMCTAVATATVDGRRVESPAFSFYVKPFTPETSPRPQDVALLEQLSRVSGGQFCDPGQLDQVLSNLGIKSSEQERVTYSTRWNTSYILAALMLLLTTEWTLRKVRNLA